MSERLNKTSICSIVFLDIAEYSQKPVSEQIECKEQFNRLINEAIENVAQNDRILLDTGDGAAIAMLGAPEEALFVSLTIRDGILKGNQERSNAHLFVRIGINLGPVRVVKDINGQLSIIGDGINVAQRVMSFAKPNQILVSRSYYEIVSRLSEEFTQMFTYSGIKQDKHVREHEVYMIRPSSEHASLSDAAMDESGAISTHQAPDKRKTRSVALAAVLLALLIGGAFFLSKPNRPAEPLTPVAMQHAQPIAAAVESKPVAEPEKSTGGQVASSPASEKPIAADKPKKTVKAKQQNKSNTTKSAEHHSAEYKPAEATPQHAEATKPSTQHHETKDRVSCTIVQRSLNQCQ